jgi:hypothetical protein
MKPNLKAIQRALEDRLGMEGKCACGGTLIPHPWRRLRWMCDRSHWWNRRKHAYLVGKTTKLTVVREKHE